MNDLSLYILDLCQNSIRANATLIKITIKEIEEQNILLLEIVDNGCGIPKDKIKEVFNPYYTTRNTRSVGMGLSLFSEIVKNADGNVIITCDDNVTKLSAEMTLNHIDRLELGDIEETIVSLIINEDIEINFTYFINNNKYFFNTKTIKEVLGDVPILEPSVLSWIKSHLRNELSELRSKR